MKWSNKHTRYSIHNASQLLVYLLTMHTYYVTVIPMAKRPLEFTFPTKTKQFREDTQPPLSPSKIVNEQAHANFEGLVTCVSEFKPSRYFEGEITDRETVTRFVGFIKKKRDEIEVFYKHGKPVLQKNCQIQVSKYSKAFEVQVKDYTKIEPSEENYDIDNIESVGSPLITLQDLQSKSQQDRVTVCVSIVRVDNPETSGNNTKQNVTIAESTGIATLALWNDNK